MKRSSRIFALRERTALLEALGCCREACIDAARQLPLGDGEKGATYRANGTFLEALDAYVAHLTGDRAHFHQRQHTGTFPTAQELEERQQICASCLGARWICEAHPDVPWTHDGCTEAGAPCPSCNTSDPPAPPPGFRSSMAS